MILEIYTDGACSNNGRGKAATAGYGVFFGKNDPRNKYGRLDANLPQTNQRAELTAILRALEICEKDPSPIVIYSDSVYSIQCVTNWLQNWKLNNFKTANKKPVKNLDLILKIDSLIETRKKNSHPVTFVHVLGHASNFGNIEADKLAQAAIKSIV